MLPRQRVGWPLGSGPKQRKQVLFIVKERKPVGRPRKHIRMGIPSSAISLSNGRTVSFSVHFILLCVRRLRSSTACSCNTKTTWQGPDSLCFNGNPNTISAQQRASPGQTFLPSSAIDPKPVPAAIHCILLGEDEKLKLLVTTKPTVTVTACTTPTKIEVWKQLGTGLAKKMRAKVMNAVMKKIPVLKTQEETSATSCPTNAIDQTFWFLHRSTYTFQQNASHQLLYNPHFFLWDLEALCSQRIPLLLNLCGVNTRQPISMQ